MFTHYISAAWRSLKRDRAYAAINLAGLSVGMAVALLIGLYVVDEMSYDRWSTEADRTARIVLDWRVGERDVHAPLSPGPLADTLKERLPGVEAVSRINTTEQVVRAGEERYHEKQIFWVDENFFEFFSLPLNGAEASDVLAQPDRVVLSPQAAIKYFGTEQAIGKVLSIEDRPYTVAAISDLGDRNLHFSYDVVAPLSARTRGPWIDTWLAFNIYSYFRLAPQSSFEQVETGLAGLVSQELLPRLMDAMGREQEEFLSSGGNFRFNVQPVKDIHLHSSLEHELGQNGDARRVYVLLSLALAVLLIASINYINMATARATRRGLEVGLRKCLGAERSQVRWQFLIEAGLVSASAILTALVLVVAALPSFNQLMTKDLTASGLAQPAMLATIVALFLGSAAASGLYPAFVMARFRPLDMVRRRFYRGREGWRLRAALVTFQFAVGVLMIIASLTIFRQIDFLLDKDLGFEPENVLVIENVDNLGDGWLGLKQDVLKAEGVVAASGASGLPGHWIREVYFVGEGGREDTQTSWLVSVDPDFFDTLGIELSAGRRFEENEPASGVAYVDRMAADLLGAGDPLGQQLDVMTIPRYPTVVGTFEGVHLAPLHQGMRPTVIRPLTEHPKYLAIRVTDEQASKVLPRIQSTWRRHASEQPFQATWLEDDIAAFYADESRTASLATGAALLAIFIACIGVLGLGAFTVEQRTKEIGVRKVLGASAPSIAALVTKDFVVLMGVAVLVASPIGWWLMTRWLQDFAYRISLGPTIFVSAALLALGIAVTSISAQALRAARLRPARSLRYE